MNILVVDALVWQVHLVSLLGYCYVLDGDEGHWSVGPDLRGHCPRLELNVKLEGDVLDGALKLGVGLGEFLGDDEKGGVDLCLAGEVVLVVLILLAEELDLLLS